MPEAVAAAVTLINTIPPATLAGYAIQASVLVASAAVESASRPAARPRGADFHRPAPTAASINLRVACDYGPRAYVMSVGGRCLGDELPDRVTVLVDPDRRAEPGDVVVIWPDDARTVAVGDDAPLLLTDDEMANPSADVCEALRGRRSSRVWAYGKRLVRPLPPVETWAEDTNHSLVVEMVNPRMELRANLSGVLAVDPVIAILDIREQAPG